MVDDASVGVEGISPVDAFPDPERCLVEEEVEGSWGEAASNDSADGEAVGPRLP